MQDDAVTVSDHSLSQIKLLAGLPEEAIQAIQSRCEWLTLSPGQSLDGPGLRDGDVYFVEAGGARIKDDECVAGDTFGALTPMPVGGDAPVGAGSGPCVLGVLGQDVFRALLLKFPKVALRLIDGFATATSRPVESDSGAATLSPKQRILGELLRLAAPNPVGDGSWVIDKLPNHDELAAVSGSAKQDVAMTIGSLAREGILERKHRTLVIRDQPRLRLMAQM